MSMISVIIPVYNVEKYIHRCVDSVINQTYRQLEIILIDDGSPDNCGQICDEYARKDNRIKVIHKENGGLSDARNHGIEAATGEWLFFLDSDDWLHPQTIEKLYEVAVENKVSVSMCGYAQTEGSNPTVDVSMQAEMWLPRDIYLQHHIASTIACAKLYSRECFDEIRYPVGKLHEDEFVTYKILFAQERIAFIAQPYYAYFTNLDGITKSKWNPERVVVLDAYEERLSFLENLGDSELYNYTEDLFFLRLVSSYKKSISNNHQKTTRYLKHKALLLTLKSPRKLFSPDNIWVLENFFPRFMRFYWPVKIAFDKILKRKTG